ncbi:uncharacterized protein VNE69_02130 [Vairimorpha necatrix]|uniref:Membrane protein n=1 Tax=Vairimorpha necatrix TaxID=6039 RepID=A0AAX4J9M0_9MICR
MFLIFLIYALAIRKISKEEIEKIIVLTNDGKSYVVDGNKFSTRKQNEYCMAEDLFMAENGQENNERESLLTRKKSSPKNKKDGKCYTYKKALILSCVLIFSITTVGALLYNYKDSIGSFLSTSKIFFNNLNDSNLSSTNSEEPTSSPIYTSSEYIL